MDFFIHLLNEYQQFAIAISLMVSIVIAISGVLPSYFVTAGNILFFGVVIGTFLSFLGESIGAIIAFVLYRKGFRRFIRSRLSAYPKAEKIIDLENREAFWLILYLRLLPFVPSGAVTLSSSAGKVSFATFAIASSLGKIPALLIEAFSVYQIIQLSNLTMLVIVLLMIFFAFKIYQMVIRVQETKEHFE